jgi:hypothetical protein
MPQKIPFIPRQMRAATNYAANMHGVLSDANYDPTTVVKGPIPTIVPLSMLASFEHPGDGSWYAHEHCQINQRQNTEHKHGCILSFGAHNDGKD